jgi:hypothetical protein
LAVIILRPSSAFGFEYDELAGLWTARSDVTTGLWKTDKLTGSGFGLYGLRTRKKRTRLAACAECVGKAA